MLYVLTSMHCLREEADLSYASIVKTTYNGLETYMAHACGYDANAAAALGTLKILSSNPDLFKIKSDNL